MPDASDDREPIEVLAEEFLERRRRGETPSLTEYVEHYPHLAEQIRDLFPTLVFMDEIDPHSTDLSRPRLPAASELSQLGDYRILRQIGAGGMGVVYEAEQLSLQRRVALKVLSPQTLGDAKARERFRHEARAAARLHHTNIVPVYEVGQDGDVCYYAMQFIPGQGLDQVIRELRRLRAPSRTEWHDASATPETASRVAQSLLNGQFAKPPATASSATHSLSNISGTRAGHRPYYRSVALLGRQTALALAHAHGRGIVHRDVKPSNLLLDDSGVVWVTDFGLAKTADDNLTRTGELPGTLRYMAPERFEGQCDARADIYALGLTLYELLVLEPAFEASDRLHLMDRIRHRDPPRPRSVDRRLPRDLETIVLKAIDKEPRRRYQSADEVAEDLRRFLADEPIRARRTSWYERTLRWCRRKPAAALLIVVSLATLISLAVALVVATFNARLQDTNARLADALGDADRQRQKVEQLLYLNKITLAGRAWSEGDVSRTEQLLAECPPALRGWEWHFLQRHCHQEYQVLRDNPPEMYGVAYSPDGRLLVSCGKENGIRLWDASTGQLSECRAIPSLGRFRCMAFTPDTRLLAAGNNGAVVCVWDGATGEEVARLKMPEMERDSPLLPASEERTGSRAPKERRRPWPAGGVRSVAFSPGGEYLAAGGWAYLPQQHNSVAVWETATWTRKRVVDLHSEPILAVSFDPTGRELYAVFGSSTVDSGKSSLATFRAWNVANDELVQSFQWPMSGETQAAISPDGRWLALSSGDGTICLWDRPAGQQVRAFTAHAGASTHLTFSADSRRLASCGDDRHIRLYDVAGGRELAALRGHAAWVNQVAFHPAGRWLASASDDGTVRIWDTQDLQAIRRLDGLTDVSICVQLDPDGRWFIVQTDEPDRHEFLWDAQARRKVIQYAVRGWGFGWWAPHPASLSRDGTWFTSQGDWWVVGQRRRGTKVWDMRTGDVLWSARDVHGNEHFGKAEFDPQGRCLAILRAEGPPVVQLLDVATGECLWTHAEEDGAPAALAFSPEGRQLAVLWKWSGDGAADARLLFLDTADGRLLRTVAERSSMTPPLVFAPGGNLLASVGGEMGSVQFINATTGEIVRSASAHKWMVTTLAFSPDGTRLASGSHDRTIKLWDTATGQETLTLSGHRSPVTSVWFSAEGRRLMSCDHSGEVRTWDATPR